MVHSSWKLSFTIFFDFTLTALFCTLPRPIPPVLLSLPEMSRRGKREWVAIWNNDINQAIIGRIIQKDPLNNAIDVQHCVII